MHAAQAVEQGLFRDTVRAGFGNLVKVMLCDF